MNFFPPRFDVKDQEAEDSEDDEVNGNDNEEDESDFGEGEEGEINVSRKKCMILFFVFIICNLFLCWCNSLEQYINIF